MDEQGEDSNSDEDENAEPVKRHKCDEEYNHRDPRFLSKSVLIERLEAASGISDLGMMSRKADICRVLEWAEGRLHGAENLDALEELRAANVTLEKETATANVEAQRLREQLEDLRKDVVLCVAELGQLRAAEQEIQQIPSDEECTADDIRTFDTLIYRIREMETLIQTRLKYLLDNTKSTRNARIGLYRDEHQQIYQQLMLDLQEAGASLTCSKRRLEITRARSSQLQKTKEEVEDAYDLVAGGVGRVYLRLKGETGRDKRKVPFAVVEKQTQELVLTTSTCTKLDKTTYFIPTLRLSELFTRWSTDDEVNNTFLEQILRAPQARYNIMIMANGPSGSGKTHTLLGPTGIMYSAAHKLLDANGPFDVVAVQHYQKELYDVMLTPPLRKYHKQTGVSWAELEQRRIDIPEAAKYNVKKALKKVRVTTIDGLQKLMLKIDAARPTRQTMVNENSSRSHLFITFLVDKVRITFADLGGSERFNATKNNSESFKEGDSIVASLDDMRNIFVAYNKGLPIQRLLLRGGEAFYNVLNQTMQFNEQETDTFNKLFLINTMPSYFTDDPAQDAILCRASLETMNFIKDLAK